MADEFQKNKLKKENIKLWRRYLTQEGLLDGDDADIDFATMLDNTMPSIESIENDAEQFRNSVTPPPSRPQTLSNEIDRRTDQRLRQGKIQIDASIDLHGLNRYEARDKLLNFIDKSYQKGVRTLLVITGKGRPLLATDSVIEPEQGVLKQKLPEWLNEPSVRPKILKYYAAHRKDGGTGAFYVYLRKKK